MSNQQAGFSLAEIKSLLPSNMTIWNHDKLIESLNHKGDEIEALEKKLVDNKQNLLTLIQAINNKPDEISCEENVQRLFRLISPT